jgi:hypothetical protein
LVIYWGLIGVYDGPRSADARSGGDGRTSRDAVIANQSPFPNRQIDIHPQSPLANPQFRLIPHA